MTDTKRVPPINLTRSEFDLLINLVQRGDDHEVNDPDWEPLNKKLNRIERSLRAEANRDLRRCRDTGAVFVLDGPNVVHQVSGCPHCGSDRCLAQIEQ